MTTKLEEGDVFELVDGMVVYADVPEHFVYVNKRGSFKLTHTDIRIGKDFDYLKGTYIVYKTSFDGGGQNFDGPYPDGHHVWAMMAKDNLIKIDFYQSGAFTAMNEDVPITGKATSTWKIE